jgi:hypothetical protein
LHKLLNYSQLILPDTAPASSSCTVVGYPGAEF